VDDRSSLSKHLRHSLTFDDEYASDLTIVIIRRSEPHASSEDEMR
jgi:hypothetical protein